MLRGLDGHPDIGELVGDTLEVGDRRAERGAGGGVVDRDAQGRFRHPEGKGADAGAEQVEGLHRHPKSVIDLTEHLIAGDEHAVEVIRPKGCGESIGIADPVSPSASPGTANAVTPLAPAWVVLAKTVYTSASGALEMKAFSPVSR